MVKNKITANNFAVIFYIMNCDYPKTSFTFLPISAGESTT